MTRNELKADAAARLDKLTDVQLQDFHAMLENLTADKSAYETAPQHVRDGIQQGLDQLDRGEGIPHEQVIADNTAMIKARGA